LSRTVGYTCNRCNGFGASHPTNGAVHQPREAGQAVTQSAPDLPLPAGWLSIKIPMQRDRPVPASPFDLCPSCIVDLERWVAIPPPPVEDDE
jgi:hypothetical protein